jgi:hypothetical protein
MWAAASLAAHLLRLVTLEKLFVTLVHRLYIAPCKLLAATGEVNDLVESLLVPVSCQNLNSLNLTGLSFNLDIKIAAITECKSDIIFLSDVRLTNAKGVNNAGRASSLLRFAKSRQYNMHFNSSQNKRGVAILIGCNIDMTLMKKWMDQNEKNFGHEHSNWWKKVPNDCYIWA